MLVPRVFLAVAFSALAWSPASAQTDVPPGLLNRPPVAAPTSQISVAPIEVVRSMSELFNDFGGGLLQGLLTSRGLSNAALIAAQDTRVITTRTLGCCVRFSEALYSDLLAPIAVMQLIERQRIGLEDRVSAIVSDYGADDVTVRQVLSYQRDPAGLRRIVEASSGQDFRSYVSQNILAPLAAGDGSQAESQSQAIGRLLVALLNGGAFENARLLEPSTVEQMEQTQFSIHPALPGWTYGFAEMQRGGWRALQRDGVWQMAPRLEARMVVVPEAHVAYFIIVEGEAGTSFWRTLDDALFDRILTPRSATVAGTQTPAPDPAQARAVAGTYESSDEALSLAAPLKSSGERIAVRAADDGSLNLSGAENAVLRPQPGGYWAADGGNLNAVANNGRLVLSSGLYRPLPLWKGPGLYASLALMFAFGAVGVFIGERRVKGAEKKLSEIVTALAVIVAVLLAVSLFIWHASPAL